MVMVANVFRELAGLAIAGIGSLPIIEQLRTGIFRWRCDPNRNTRQQDPIGWWGWLLDKTILAVMALAGGVGLFFGVAQLHRP